MSHTADVRNTRGNRITQSTGEKCGKKEKRDDGGTREHNKKRRISTMNNNKNLTVVVFTPMMQEAHDIVVLNIDRGRLFTPTRTNFQVWLAAAATAVGSTRLC